MSIANKKLIFFSIIGLFFITFSFVFAQQDFENIVDSSLINLNNQEVITAINGLISKPGENKSRLDKYTGPDTYINLIKYGASARNNLSIIINSLKEIDILLKKGKLTEKEAQQLIAFAEQAQKSLSTAVSDLENYSTTMLRASQRLGQPGFFSPIKRGVKSSLDEGVRELNNRIIGLRNTEQLVNQSIQRGDHKKIAANLLIKPPPILTLEDKTRADLIKQIEERQERINQRRREQGFETSKPSQITIPDIIIPDNLTPAQQESLERAREKRRRRPVPVTKSAPIDDIKDSIRELDFETMRVFVDNVIRNLKNDPNLLKDVGGEKILTKFENMKIQLENVLYVQLLGKDLSREELRGLRNAFYDLENNPAKRDKALKFIDDGLEWMEMRFQEIKDNKELFDRLNLESQEFIEDQIKDLNNIDVDLEVKPTPKSVSEPAPVSTPTPKIIIYTDDKFCGPCKGLKKILIKMAGLNENATIEELREKLKDVVDIRSVRLFPEANYEDNYPKINAEDIPGLTGLPALFKDGKPILDEDNEPLIGSQITDEIRKEMERVTQSTPTPR